MLVNGLEAAGTVAWATTKQRLVPARMLGRVSSVDWFVSTALLPLSYALAAPIAAWIGVRATLVGAGLLGAVVTFGFLFLPGMRGPERAAMYRPRHAAWLRPTHAEIGLVSSAGSLAGTFAPTGHGNPAPAPEHEQRVPVAA